MVSINEDGMLTTVVVAGTLWTLVAVGLAALHHVWLRGGGQYVPAAELLPVDAMPGQREPGTIHVVRLRA